MQNPVKSRADRILGRIQAYRSIDLHQTDISDASAERIFGVYENSHDDKVYVGERGLVIAVDKVTTFLPYAQIEQLDVSEPKNVAETILVGKKDSSTVEIKIKHGSGQTRDVWEVFRFLMRVRDDLRAVDDPVLLDHTRSGFVSEPPPADQ